MAMILVFLSTALSFLISSVFAARSWAYRRSYIHRLVFIIEFGYALWAFSVISVFAIDNMAFKIFMTHVRMLGLPLLFPSWALLCAGLFLPGVSAKLRQYWYLVFLFPALVIAANLLAMAGFPAASKWMYYDFYLIPGMSGLVDFTRGPVVLAIIAFAALTIAVGFAFLMYAVFTLKGRRWQYAMVFLAAALWPFALEGLVLLGSGDLPLRQLKIAALWPFIWGLHYAANKGDVLEITSLAQQKVFEQLPGPVVILNARSEYWGGNAAALEMLGLKESWQGHLAAEIPVLRDIISGAERFQIHGLSYQIRRHNLDGDSQESQAQVYLLNDVTELEESNKALKDLNGEILKMHSFNKRVQTVLAHDLTGALAGTQLLLGVSRQDSVLTPDSLVRVREAHKASLELLRNILAWSHEGESRGGVDLKTRVNAAVGHLAPQILQKNVAVKVDLPKEEIQLWGSVRVVETILRNLLSNAVKFSPEGGTIQVTGLIMGNQVELTIQDQGPGVSAEIMASLSDSGAVMSSQDDGFGVGLKFTKDFVNQMGGVLIFDPNVTQGTRVSVRFPIGFPV
ncbi:sensor histidine kinase [Bdellovibrio bacteriovorus]|uniref:histidine kinase n=1 Tax=Bdellovibrio bacteriovorus str. Tiberius TaxID=1069642 RepID=K7YPQ8_BDEBC|nr:sensor histidine kinase [Bdellovibrio bacteriovorus]AFY01826.1 signal transduction sensor histidine kinase [Bdellovibrio bacteriovorus str. Tiberius]